MTIDKDTILQIVPGARADYASALAQVITKSGAKYGIDNPTALSVFIGQCAKETGGLRYMIESGWLKNPDAWAKKETSYWPHQGRGFIQLTHSKNYEKFSKHFFGDARLADNPALMNDNPTLGAYAALWYWKYSDNAKIGNIIAKANAGDHKGVTKLVRGISDTWQERKKYADTALAVLKKKSYKVKWAGSTSFVYMSLYAYLQAWAKATKTT
jgi:predicted chitinase